MPSLQHTAKDRATQRAELGVLLVEDNPTDVLVIRSQLEESIQFRLHAVERLSSAIEYLDVHEPNIILLDLNLPDATGLETLIKLRKKVEDKAVVVFTGLNDEELGVMALQRGAQDYLIKGVDTDRLVRSMRYAIERMRAYPFRDDADCPGNGNSDSLPYEVLTEREMQVLRLMGKGCTNQEIVESLGISLTTVKTHVGNIFQKLLVSDRTKAVVEAYRRRLI
jgi:DNA-binding NarL/FixJ family response regulator